MSKFLMMISLVFCWSYSSLQNFSSFQNSKSCLVDSSYFLIVSRSTQFLKTELFFLKTISFVLDPNFLTMIGIFSVRKGATVEWLKNYVSNTSSDITIDDVDTEFWGLLGSTSSG